MTAIATDVVIAGAGLPGLALACALGDSGLAVAIADRAKLDAAAGSTSEWDARVYAVSPGSVAFLESLGAWSSLPIERVEAVESMRVVGDDGAVLTFSAYDEGERALAWIVEERELRRSLLTALSAKRVRVLAPVALEHLAFSADTARIDLGNGDAIDAKLVVGADGIRSWVRNAAGIVGEPRFYTQTAIVANFECERAHRGCARQWFHADGGVLAWLPLPGSRISIVWSAPTMLADELLALDDAAFASRVAAAGEHALGALRVLTPRATFPLQYLRLASAVAHRTALIGDAAHGVHPLAGQGVNLGFGDAHALAQVLAERGPVSDPGTPVLLERYALRRYAPVFAVQAVTDGLARLFGARSAWIARLRNAGLDAVDRMPMIKHALAQSALRS
ncbi:MAG TPA: FAD-dependent monooxygenase [Casimicrobiaceae bacterium]|nr:FAD-dependent monooxygenase [Casimicrobiaceae bacterium]